MARSKKLTDQDVGIAMMAWYADALEQYPDGLVTQAQAAMMLDVSRVAVSRLVARGYLRAVYFPKPPEIGGIAVGHDDPMWLKLAAWIGDVDESFTFPKACFVSFGDVIELWKAGNAQEKCKRDWRELTANFYSKEERHKRMSDIHQGYQEQARLEHEERDQRKLNK